MIDFIKSPYSQGEMLPYERYKLYNWILEIKPGFILETGCGTGGGSTCYMSEAILDSGISCELHTCDPLRQPEPAFFKKYPFVKYHREYSSKMIQDITSQNKKIDFIMFDAPEDPNVAMDDMKILENHIGDGTHFCMHDWECEKRGYDHGVSKKALLIRPYIENSKNWIKVEVLSGLRKNSEYDATPFDSVGLCLYKFKRS